MTSAPCNHHRLTIPAKQLHLPSAPARHVSQLAALWTLYTLTLRQHLHGKRWMVMIATVPAAGGLAILVRVHGPPSVAACLLEFFVGFMFIPQAMLAVDRAALRLGNDPG